MTEENSPNVEGEMIKIMTMKKVLYTFFALVALVFTSCSNKVDLYAGEGEYTIVYATLDASLDTSFFKITHSFLGNANELAMNYDANNYKYDEIEVKFTGKFNDSNNTETILLDTISKWIPYDPEATFYTGCYQTYYYTIRKLKEGEEYTVEILRKTDNVTVSATTSTINSFVYQKPPTTMPITFTDYQTSTATVEWRVRDYPFKSTASYFEVTGYFNYKELQPGASDTVYRSIEWPLGSGTADALLNTSSNIPYYVISYAPAQLYVLLANDKYLKENSPHRVKRWFEKFTFRVSGIGDELYNYYLITNSSSAIQDVPNYTNVENGYGIVSARVSKDENLVISDLTKRKVIELFPEYGFQELP